MSAMTVTVCMRNKYGFCKFGEYCRKQHNNELCDLETCDTFSCEKRHPQKCFYFNSYGRCKFGTFCRYAHRNEYNCTRDNTNNHIEEKIRELRENNNLIEEEVKTLKNDIEYLKRENDNLRKEVEKLVSKKEDTEKNDNSEKEKNEYQCDICEFKSTKKNGLSVHKKKKHFINNQLDGNDSFNDSDECDNEDESSEIANYTRNEEIKEFKCEWCGYNAGTDDRLRKHMNYRQHGYWKCEECNFKMTSKDYSCDSCFSLGRIVPDNDM